MLDGHPRTGELMPVLDPLSAAAACGLERYDSDVFGADYRDNLFLCQFNLRKVSRHILQPSGSTFASEDSDFVSSDFVDFHPTDVLVDADGSLLVIDTGGWYKLCCPTSQLWKPDVLGGIYRVRQVGAKPPNDPRGRKIEWAKQTPQSTLGASSRSSTCRAATSNPRVRSSPRYTGTEDSFLRRTPTAETRTQRRMPICAAKMRTPHLTEPGRRLHAHGLYRRLKCRMRGK